MLSGLDVVLFVAFLAAVAAVALAGSRDQHDRADYFLAGRNLGGLLVGFSLIASNISTEHFVGMTGTAARIGLAVAVYEWLAAPALVFVAWWLLPRFLRAGLYTIPEFLEYRFDRGSRTILAALMVVFFVLTVLATVLYTGATFLSGVLDLPGWLEGRFGLTPEAAEGLAFQVGLWGIALAAGVYTVIGGLRAVVLSDLLQGAALLLGGTAVAFLALAAIGDGAGIGAGWTRFTAENADRLHVIRPWDDPDVPPHSLMTGLWIPVMFYWGLNQFIVQRTLAAGSLAAGQKGILLAAGIKLFLPFLVVLPGLMAVQLLGADYDATNPDGAYPALLRTLLPSGLLGLMLAAVSGSIMSTFNSGLNSAATVFTLDLWPRLTGEEPQGERAVRIGRWTTLVLAIAACLWAPVIRSFSGVFAYIQEFWGFVSAPTCAVFAAGLLLPRVPAAAARAALVAGPLLYLASRLPTWLWTAEEADAEGGLVAALYAYGSRAFLDHMFLIFLLLFGGLWLWGRLAPLAEPARLPDRAVVDMRPMRGLRAVGGVVLAATAVLLYVWR